MPRTCTLCQTQPAIAHCPRCAAPLCLEHQPAAGMLCVECELDYVRGRERIHFALWRGLGVVVTVAAIAALWGSLPSGRQGGYRAITTGSAHLDVTLMGVVVAWFLGASFAGIRSHLARRAFLSRSGSRAPRLNPLADSRAGAECSSGPATAVNGTQPVEPPPPLI